jgi:hypothetical protein
MPFIYNFLVFGFAQAGASEHARTLGPKGSDPHKAAVIGYTIGDPLKDTSGPSLNILIKLMAVESLIFAPLLRRPWWHYLQMALKIATALVSRKRKAAVLRLRGE